MIYKQIFHDTGQETVPKKVTPEVSLITPDLPQIQTNRSVMTTDDALAMQRIK